MCFTKKESLAAPPLLNHPADSCKIPCNIILKRTFTQFVAPYSDAGMESRSDSHGRDAKLGGILRGALCPRYDGERTVSRGGFLSLHVVCKAAHSARRRTTADLGCKTGTKGTNVPIEWRYSPVPPRWRVLLVGSLLGYKANLRFGWNMSKELIRVSPT